MAMETALEDGAEFVKAGHDKKTVYYYIDIYADEKEWEENLQSRYRPFF